MKIDLNQSDNEKVRKIAEKHMADENYDYAFVDLWHNASGGLDMYLKMKMENKKYIPQALEETSACNKKYSIKSVWIQTKKARIICTNQIIERGYEGV